ncbi:hypothetical protein AB1M95_09660 [Sulfitobacter sp. LCG007]
MREGCLAAPLLVDGDPVRDLRSLENHDRLLAIMKDGKLHESPDKRRSAQVRTA